MWRAFEKFRCSIQNFREFKVAKHHTVVYDRIRSSSTNERETKLRGKPLRKNHRQTWELERDRSREIGVTNAHLDSILSSISVSSDPSVSFPVAGPPSTISKPRDSVFAIGIRKHIDLGLLKNQKETNEGTVHATRNEFERSLRLTWK